MHRAKGFTLAELLIAIAILGILASLALPRLFPQTERARVSEAVNTLGAIRQGEASYFLDHGVYFTVNAADPNTTWNNIGMDNPNNQSVYFTYSVAAGSPATTFVATGTRTAVNDGGGNVGRTVTLTDAGIWGGTHPSRPT